MKLITIAIFVWSTVCAPCPAAWLGVDCAAVCRPAVMRSVYLPFVSVAHE